MCALVHKGGLRMCNRLCQLFHYRLTDFCFHYYCPRSHGHWQKPEQSHVHTHGKHAESGLSSSIKEAICSSGCAWAKRQVGGCTSVYLSDVIRGDTSLVFASVLPFGPVFVCASGGLSTTSVRERDYIKSWDDNWNVLIRQRVANPMTGGA